MNKCICGLDHYKPIPDVFKDAPIVFSSSHEEGICHACRAFGPNDKSFFINPALHKEDCKYMKYLKNKDSGNLKDSEQRKDTGMSPFRPAR